MMKSDLFYSEKIKQYIVNVSLSDIVFAFKTNQNACALQQFETQES